MKKLHKYINNKLHKKCQNCQQAAQIFPQNRANFRNPKQKQNALSTEQSCLAETGYQLKFHKVYIVENGALLNFRPTAYAIGPRSLKYIKRYLL